MCKILASNLLQEITLLSCAPRKGTSVLIINFVHRFFACQSQDRSTWVYISTITLQVRSRFWERYHYNLKGRYIRTYHNFDRFDWCQNNSHPAWNMLHHKSSQVDFGVCITVGLSDRSIQWSYQGHSFHMEEGWLWYWNGRYKIQEPSRKSRYSKPILAY